MEHNNLEFKNIKIKFKNMNNSMLENASFKINNKMQVALIGPSGIGKTSLLNVFFKNDFLKEGKIIFNNEDINKFNKKQYKNFVSQISLLNQQPNLIFEETVYNNIKRSIRNDKNLIYKLFGILSKKQRIKIYESLDNLGILDKAHTIIKELSGGQQQRVEICKMMITNPNIILADEPTSSLDIETSQKIIQQIKKLATSNNAILIVSLHDIDLVKKYFDFYISLKDKIAILEPINKLTNQEIKRIYKGD